MNGILQEYLRKFVLAFFDDILIYSKTWEEHLEHLDQVLKTLQQHQFYANYKKCELGKQEVQYLGHIISRQGVQMDPHKVSVILQRATPKSLKALRGFIGLTEYYRRFIYNYGHLARPLTQLLKKGNFGWTTESMKAMQQLKTAVTTTPEVVEEENQQDPMLKKIVEELKTNLETHENYTQENGRLHYKGQMVISGSSSWIPRLLNEYHTTLLGGHAGIFRTYRRIGQSLHWMGMKKSVNDLSKHVWYANKINIKRAHLKAYFSHCQF